MNRVMASLGLIFLMVISAQITHAQQPISTKDFSGWMKNYDSLIFDKDRNAFIFENEVKSGVYEKIMLESVVLHGVGVEQNPEIADQANEYLYQGIRDIMQSKGIGADQAGPKVLRVNVAITGVRKSKESLKVYHVLPVAAVFRGAQEVSGTVGTYIDTQFEGEMVDSITGERVVAIVAKGIEDTSKRSGDKLHFDDVKPTLDKWLSQLEENLDKNLASR